MSAGLSPAGVAAGRPLLSIAGLRVEAMTASGPIVAVDDLTFDVAAGDTVAVVGESGSGKTTAVRAVMGLLERNVRVTAGRVAFAGRELTGARSRALDEVRGRDIGIIFQSAMSSLNPVLKVGTQLREVLDVHRPDLTNGAKREVMEATLASMGLGDAGRVLRAYPHQLSGGMRQRVAIALAVVAEPALLIADECTSALDVTTQEEVVALLRRLVAEREMALLFVTHDLRLAVDICARVLVMYGGRVMEAGATAAVLDAPVHPYARALVASLPPWAPRRRLVGIDGTPIPVRHGDVGCAFAPRCAMAVPACAGEVPLQVVEAGRAARCVHVGAASGS